MSDSPVILVSSCLLGQRVRYDGQEKSVAWIAGELREWGSVLAICPEVGSGMTVPRPPIQIVQIGKKRHVQVVASGEDVTESLAQYIDAQILQIGSEGLDGAILKARSPSCGIRDTPHFGGPKGKERIRDGAGIWADTLMRRFPKVPIVDESELLSRSGQETFIARVLVHFQARTG